MKRRIYSFIKELGASKEEDHTFNSNGYLHGKMLLILCARVWASVFIFFWGKVPC